MASNYFNKKRGVSPNDNPMNSNDSYNYNMYSQEDQAALNGNTNRSKPNINYGAIATTAGAGAGMIASTYNNPNSTGNDKYDTTSNAFSSTIGSINPVIGAFTSIGDSIGKPIKAKSEQFDENGNLLNENKVKRNAVIGSLFSPTKALSYRSASGNWGDISGKGYTQWLENQEKDRLQGLQPVADPYENIQRMAYGGMKYPNGGKANISYTETPYGFKGWDNDIIKANQIQNTIDNNKYYQNISKSGLTEEEYFKKYPNYNTFKYQNDSNNLKNRFNNTNIFAMGGMNTLPNSEVELQENSIAPDGTFTQYDGPSHSDGGVKTNLDNNEIVFSDRLKPKGSKKTFAELNKTNNTNKEDKILEKANNSVTKNTALLMKQIKSKLSQELFNQQEQLKQEKVLNYAKRTGISPDQLEFTNGGMKKYPDGGKVSDPDPRRKMWAKQNGYVLSPGGFGEYYDPRVFKPNPITNSDSTKVYDWINTQDPNWKYTEQTSPFVKYQPEQQIKPQGNQFPTVNVGKQLPKFEYVNDASKGDYNQQFENYKKVYIPTYAKGGRKKDPNDINNMTSSNQRDYQAWFNANSQNEDFNPDDFTIDQFMSQYGNSSNDINTTNNRFNTTNQLNNTPNNKVNWTEIGKQAAYFAANNAGNLYDLSRSNKSEITKYDRIKANLLDPSATIRDIDHQNRVAEYDIRSASNGNAGSYLANRTALATNAAINKDRVSKDYSNINAQIKNQNSALNAQIQMRENDANEMNRAATRSTKQAALARMGSNTAQQMNDIRNTSMDKKKVDALIKMYPALSKNPEMLEYILSYKK